MPIQIPNDLPATGILQQENIFVMTEHRAVTQDIRPLEIVLVNLMPTKVVTVTYDATKTNNENLIKAFAKVKIKADVKCCDDHHHAQESKSTCTDSCCGGH